MGLRWEPKHWGHGRLGYDERGMLAGSVVRYDDSEMVLGDDGISRLVITGSWWAAFVCNERVEGRHETAEAAMAAAEQAHHRSPAG